MTMLFKLIKNKKHRGQACKLADLIPRSRLPVFRLNAECTQVREELRYDRQHQSLTCIQRLVLNMLVLSLLLDT